MRTKIGVLVVLIALTSGLARADTIPFSGSFNDTGNTALVWSDLGPALFGDDWEIANNVAVYQVNIPFSGNVRFLSLGFAAGGVDPYFTLFDGTGAGATVLGSNYGQAFATGGDFDLSFFLTAGTYTFAMGVFANMSFAENWGSGTLGDGFIQLGGPGFLGDPQGAHYAYYDLDVTRPDGPQYPVPEPATLLLVGSGVVSVSGIGRRLKRS
jgi:hypothetical protein